MRQTQQVYTPKNVITLVVVFVILFWLLYSIGSFLHESQKISDEIETIRKSNIAAEEAIEEKKKELAYLKTPQRIEKEAKIQMGKKRPGEKVLVLIEEELPVLPTEKRRQQRQQIHQVENWQKWQWVFLGDKR